MKIAVLVAMQEEAEAILADPVFGWTVKAPGLFLAGTTPEPVVLCLTGIGKVHAAWGLSRVLAGFPALDEGGQSGTAKDDLLVFSLGTSGALDDTPVGSLVLCSEFVEHDMDVTAIGYPAGVSPQSGSRDPVYRTAEPSLIEAVLEPLRKAGYEILEGRTLSGDQFVADPAVAEGKLALFRGEGPVVVDMESAAIAKLRCGKAAGPYLALRYVSDNADHDAGNSWDKEVGKAALVFDRVLRLLSF